MPTTWHLHSTPGDGELPRRTAALRPSPHATPQTHPIHNCSRLSPSETKTLASTKAHQTPGNVALPRPTHPVKQGYHVVRLGGNGLPAVLLLGVPGPPLLRTRQRPDPRRGGVVGFDTPRHLLRLQHLHLAWQPKKRQAR